MHNRCFLHTQKVKEEEEERKKKNYYRVVKAFEEKKRRKKVSPKGDEFCTRVQISSLYAFFTNTDIVEVIYFNKKNFN